MDDPGMVSMFQALMASGLERFLGCPAVIYEAALKLLLVDFVFSARLSVKVTRVSQHFGVLTIISADDYLDSADALVKERSADGLRAADRYDGVGVT
ncbi:hypothetical protein F511_09149 [Dorcoceras hygrometricum]|uniref:Uncharacterized protein n=1 Tax=Dorcoceras hygrometricum TaxID=472368 RepID=A0A2Z7AMV0_9LAMI|nr:hypothetical protein F511_09149 [Dorcoceras hygrometricum]